MKVRHITTILTLTDEMIVDGQFGSLEEQLAAAARIEERQRAARARWDALPARVRLARRLRWKLRTLGFSRW